jgi:hypothetical protein
LGANRLSSNVAQPGNSESAAAAAAADNDKERNFFHGWSSQGIASEMMDGYLQRT